MQIRVLSFLEPFDTPVNRQLGMHWAANRSTERRRSGLLLRYPLKGLAKSTRIGTSLGVPFEYGLAVGALDLDEGAINHRCGGQLSAKCSELLLEPFLVDDHDLPAAIDD